MRLPRTPEKIQDLLDTLRFNKEKKAETCRSPQEVLRHNEAHCLEGALLAAAALQAAGERPLLMNLKASRGDYDHAVALFKRNGYWGAISKTNHAVLRYRDPIYKTQRELALSYFHEYFLNDTGRKTLLAYSKPFDLTRYGKDWITSTGNLWDIADALRDSPHTSIVPSGTKLRSASIIERKAGDVVEW